jgi:flavin reductase (DIM6/NTAB) family NADH-FMN oxidoreductase RutF
MSAFIETFKAAMSRFATGVTIVTTKNADAFHGFTVNAFASVTTDPPTVLVCVNRSSHAHPLISNSGSFCVNILSLEQRQLAERFHVGEPRERFVGVEHRVGPSGAPILENVLAYVDCEVQEEYSAGTHTIFIGRVLQSFERDGRPLGYYNRAYRDFNLPAN